MSDYGALTDTRGPPWAFKEPHGTTSPVCLSLFEGDDPQGIKCIVDVRKLLLISKTEITFSSFLFAWLIGSSWRRRCCRYHDATIRQSASQSLHSLIHPIRIIVQYIISSTACNYLPGRRGMPLMDDPSFCSAMSTSLSINPSFLILILIFQ